MECAIATSDVPPSSLHTTTSVASSSGLAPQDARDWLYLFAMQTLDYALLVVDPSKRILWANSGAAWILAATVAEIVGSQITDYFTPGDIDLGIPEHELRSALRQGSSGDDRWMLRADGSPFWASGKTVALRQPDGTPMGFFKIFRDQTESKMRVEALERHTGPGDGALPSGAVEPLSLGDELQAVIAQAATRQAAPGPRIELLMPPAAPITLEGNRERLRQAFAVLLDHAVEATGECGSIWINGTVEVDQAVVHVENTGRGLDVDALAMLFELFTRPQSPAPQDETSLALVRRIVDEHAGSVQARSEGAGKGSEFVVRLPLRQPGRERPTV